MAPKDYDMLWSWVNVMAEASLHDPYLSHWVPDTDQPHYPPGTDAFRLYEPNGRQVIAWLAGDHIPCWLDFLPNRDIRALFLLRRGDGELVPVPAGPLRQCIGQVMWSMVDGQ